MRSPAVFDPARPVRSMAARTPGWRPPDLSGWNPKVRLNVWEDSSSADPDRDKVAKLLTAFSVDR